MSEASSLKAAVQIGDAGDATSSSEHQSSDAESLLAAPSAGNEIVEDTKEKTDTGEFEVLWDEPAD